MARVTWLWAVLTALLSVDAHAVFVARYDHTSTLLPDRSILLCGGTDDSGTALDSCELYLPDGSAVNLPAVMSVARTSHTATVLPNGLVLVAGGVDDGGAPLASAQLYDPATRAFLLPVIAMGTARYNHTATLLKTGLVLVCGGQPTLGGNPTATCERYDPGANDFTTPTASMQAARARHTAVLLRDGRVWIAGGYDQSNSVPTLVTTELYVPALNFFGAAKSLIVARADHTATMLGDGRVFVAGGHNGRNLLENQGYLDTTELYDPISDSVIPGAKMLVRRHAHTATLMPTGDVVTFGGLGNITTTYLDALNEDIIDVGVGNPSSVTGNTLVQSNFPAVNITSGSLRLDLSFKLGTELSGVIQDGDIFMSTPTVTFSGGAVYFRSGVSSTPSVGFRVDLDGSNVGCVDTIANCGNVDRPFLPADFNLLTPGVQGSLVADPVGATADSFSISGTHEIHFLGGTLEESAQIQFLSSGTITGTTRLRGLPQAFSGFAILGGTFTLNDLTFVQLGSFTVSASAGFMYIPAGTRIVDDPGALGTAMTSAFTALVQLTDGNVIWNGDDQVYTSPLTTPLDGLSPSVTMSGSLNYAPSGATLSGAALDVLFSTVVVRTMLFSDVETYTPNTNSWASSLRWALGSTPQTHRHTATLQPHGRIRFLGGRACDLATRNDNCNDLDPLFFDFSYSQVPIDWLDGAALGSPRGNHTATLLPSGMILLAGGTNGPNILATSELFDPATETYSPAGRMHYARDIHTASLLTDGRVLVAGGFSTTAGTGATKTAEIFYPGTRLWLEASPMISSRSNHTAVVLPNGNVMVMGGYADGLYLSSTEIYYSTSGHWRAGPPMPGARALHSATLLSDGRIMVVGGINSGGILGSTFFYNTANETWAAGPALAGGQHSHSHTASLLPDGRLLVAGGNDEFGETKMSQIYSNDTGSWSIIGELVVPRLAHSAHVLPNGDLLIAGGAQAPGNAVVQSELFSVSGGSWSLNSNHIVARAYGAVVLAGNNTLYSFGGYDGVSFVASMEKRFYTLPHDQSSSFAPPSTREPLVLSSDLQVVGRGQKITAAGLNFLGNTEASSGGTSGSSHSSPRITLQRLPDGNGSAAQGGSPFDIDLTTSIYANTDNLWTNVNTSITVQAPVLPGALPYGWYHLRVGANGQFSASRLIQAGPPKPAAAVTSLFATALDTSTLTWSWTAPGGGFDGYNVYSATTGVLITTRPVATDNACAPYPCFTQRSLIPNASAQIIVAPFSLTGDGPLLQSATRFTLASPVGLTLASTTADTVFLTWNSSGNRTGTVYEITQSTDNFLTISTPVAASDNYQGLFYSISPLTDNTVYSFRIRSFNGDGIPSGFSNVVSTRTRSPVNGLSGVPLNTYSIQWTWLDPGGVTNYRVYNATTGAFIAAPTSNVYIDTNLSTNTARAVNVSAVTGAGEGPLAPAVTVYTLAAVPVAGTPPVTNLSTGSFVVNYFANQNPLNTRYLLGVSSTGPTGVTTATTVGLAAGFGDLFAPSEIWDITIVAINEDNVQSAPLVIGSTATMPEAPSSLAVLSTGLDSIEVIWNEGNNTSSTTYQVTYTTDNFVNNVATAVAFSQGFGGNSLIISGLETSTTYSIRVVAKNPHPFNRETVFSNIVTTRTSSGGAVLGSLAGQVPYQQNVVISGTLGTTPPRFIKLDIPANTFTSDVRIEVSSHDLLNSGLCVAPDISTTNVAIRITVDPPIQPVGKIFVTMGYSAAEVGNLPDSRLSILRHEPAASKCVPLMSSNDSSLRRITAPLNHLSVYQLATINPASAVSGMRMFPNPWYASRNAFVTFHQIPADATVKLFTLRGELVHEFRSNSSGIVSWDGKNRNGRKVASGVYFAVVESGGDQRIMKLVVLK